MRSKSTCGTCKYEWDTGMDGSHSCSKVLLKKLNRIEEALERLSKELDISHPLAKAGKFVADGMLKEFFK